MPLLEAQSKIGFSRETYKLPTDLKSELQQYCRFANSDADHIVVKALQYVFAKDKDFAAWKKTSAALPVVEETSQRKAGDRRRIPHGIQPRNSKEYSHAEEINIPRAGHYPRRRPFRVPCHRSGRTLGFARLRKSFSGETILGGARKETTHRIICNDASLVD